MKSPAIYSSPPFIRPQKASQKIAELMQEDHVVAGEKARLFLAHLAKIEEIEARLGQCDLAPGELETLVKTCHEILNEVQELHLTAYLDHIYVHHKPKA